MDSIDEATCGLKSLTVWDVERRLERLADRFYREQRYQESLPFGKDSTLLERLRKAYREVADYHVNRFETFGTYHYYVI